MKKVFRIILIIGIPVILIISFLLITPFLFKEKLEEVVKRTAHKTLNTELNFSGMEVSFLRHFPHLTVTLTDFVLKSSAPFDQDTLISAHEISLGVNLCSLIEGPIEITRIYVDRGQVNILFSEKGEPNYAVYDSGPDTLPEADTSSGIAAIKIDYIIFKNTGFIYSDLSLPLKIIAKGIDYHGKNDIAGEIMKLNSRVNIASLDLYYDRTHYIQSKPLTGDLETQVNLSSLDMKFTKNELRISDIPFEFKGELSFRKDGYEFFLSLFSMFGEEYMSGSFWLKSARTLWLSAKADINITLEKWIKGLAMKDTDLRGYFSMKLKAAGYLISGPDPGSTRGDTIYLSIPDYQITARLKNGYFHYKELPQAIKDISFDISSSATNHDFKTINVALENLKASFLDNTVNGFFRVKNIHDYPVEAHLSSSINLGELYQAIPFDSLTLKGILGLEMDLNGNYHPKKHQFPVATLNLTLRDGAIQTKYYPRPIENIQIDASVTNKTGELSGTKIRLDPFSFTFEGNPFEFSGDFSNPDNLIYSVVSKGSVDLAGIYQLFSQEGMDLAGFIATDLILKGTQQDALAGHYERLHNSGKLVLRDIKLTSEYLPKPLILKSGIFWFQNDQVWFEQFDCSYGSSDIRMNGNLSNVINYLLARNQPLYGNFTFHSNFLLVDEFMAPTGAEADTLAKDTIPEGVIVIPPDLEIGMQANVKKIEFQDLFIKDFKCDVEAKKGLLLLKSMNFDLVGCRVAMDASYGSITPEKAFFDFHVIAKDFDIKRAYNEVELIRNLSSSAGKCEGIVSLDYSLQGKLDAGMNPIYPSLQGGGILTLEKVKVMGMKLFTSLSKNLEKDALKNPNLSKVELKTTIKNNVITLERTRMKIAGFRFRAEGETSFNGKLNLKTRLGLPPLGIVGIPIRILGTHQNPKFKYGRGNSDEDIEETVYTDELTPELWQMIRNAKEE